MEKAEEKREKGCFSRDLLMGKSINENHLQDFMGTSRKRNREFHENVKEGEDDVELSLGLSLNGRFGVDRKRAKILNRSSSTTNFVFSGDNSNGNENSFPLSRACSLPTETEEEWSKRRELQSRYRLEAKKKRMEKMKNVKVVKENEASGNSLPSSGGSQGSGSSGMTDLESQQSFQGPSGSSEATRPANGQSQELELKPVATAPGKTEEKSPVSAGTIDEEAKEMFRNFMLKMPCVSTRGDGPNGKKIQGFLYQYKNVGDELKIVCVCHGTFLTPAEFVKHAGGGDIENPLRHIIINPAPLL